MSCHIYLSHSASIWSHFIERRAFINQQQYQQPLNYHCLLATKIRSLCRSYVQSIINLMAPNKQQFPPTPTQPFSPTNHIYSVFVLSLEPIQWKYNNPKIQFYRAIIGTVMHGLWGTWIWCCLCYKLLHHVKPFPRRKQAQFF